MWAYGPSFDLGFDTPTVWSPSTGEPSFSSSEGGQSHDLSRDPRASEEPLGAQRRLEGVVERLEALYRDQDLEDACPELGINSADVSWVTSTTEAATVEQTTPTPASPSPAIWGPFSAPRSAPVVSATRGPFSAPLEEPVERPLFTARAKTTTIKRIQPVTSTQAPGGDTKKEGGSH